jgi:hypothetical protein
MFGQNKKNNYRLMSDPNDIISPTERVYVTQRTRKRKHLANEATRCPMPRGGPASRLVAEQSGLERYSKDLPWPDGGRSPRAIREHLAISLINIFSLARILCTGESIKRREKTSMTVYTTRPPGVAAGSFTGTCITGAIRKLPRGDPKPTVLT